MCGTNGISELPNVFFISLLVEEFYEPTPFAVLGRKKMHSIRKAFLNPSIQLPIILLVSIIIIIIIIIIINYQSLTKKTVTTEEN